MIHIQTSLKLPYKIILASSVQISLKKVVLLYNMDLYLRTKKEGFLV